jgi:hypothetical protein
MGADPNLHPLLLSTILFPVRWRMNPELHEKNSPSSGLTVIFSILAMGADPNLHPLLLSTIFFTLSLSTQGI